MSTSSSDPNDVDRVWITDNISRAANVRPVWTSALTDSDRLRLLPNDYVIAYCEEFGETVHLNVHRPITQPGRGSTKLPESHRRLKEGIHGIVIAAAPSRPGFWLGVVDKTIEVDGRLKLARSRRPFDVTYDSFFKRISQPAWTAADDAECPCNTEEQIEAGLEAAIDFSDRLRDLYEAHD